MTKYSKLTRKSMILIGTTLLLGTTVFSGCSNNNSSKDAVTSTDSSDPATGIDHSKPLTITLFNNAANYQGEQTGWYGKLIKDKFNITLNVLSPQVAGDQLYK